MAAVLWVCLCLLLESLKPGQKPLWAKKTGCTKCLPSHPPSLSKFQRKTLFYLWKHPLLFLVILLTTPRKEFCLSRFPLSLQKSACLGNTAKTVWGVHDQSHTEEGSTLVHDCQYRIQLMPRKPPPLISLSEIATTRGFRALLPMWKLLILNGPGSLSL